MAIQREHELKWYAEMRQEVEQRWGIDFGFFKLTECLPMGNYRFQGRKQLEKKIEERQAGRKKLDDIL